MQALYSIISGILQALFEYLPVSSSALVDSFSRAVNFADGTGAGYTAFVHAGTTLALILCMKSMLLKTGMASFEIVKDFFRNITYGAVKRDNKKRVINGNERRTAMIFWISAVPSLLIGFLLRRAAEFTFGHKLYTSAGFFITALLLFICHMSMIKPVEGERRVAKAWILGIAQGLSVFPGVSRLGAVYAGGMLSGYGRKSSASLSYLISVPFLLGAVIYEFATLEGSVNILYGLLGLLSSAVCGYFTFRIAHKLVRSMRPGAFAGINFVLGILYLLSSFSK